MIPIRALPRCFLPECDFSEPTVTFPVEEYKKFHHVLRLKSGVHLALFPNDGTVWRAEYHGKTAHLMSQEPVPTESSRHVVLAQALPKPDRLDEVIRAGSELGVSEFWLFPSDRTVVQWSPDKLADRVRRLQTIAREACEVAFRGRLPAFSVMPHFSAVLEACPAALILSEDPLLRRSFTEALARVADPTVVVIGPEGGWSPREVDLIGDRGLTLGARTLRVLTAATAACSLALCE